MSKLDKLIAELCPGGVKYCKLGELEDEGLIKLGRGSVISKKDIAEFPGDFPIYSSSASGVGEFGRYSKFMFDDERISWSVDGGGRFFYRHAHKYSVTNVSGWLKVNDTDAINLRYLFYTLDSAWTTKKFDYTKKAHPSVIRVEYTIPIPPLEVQKEIVKILDTFTQLEAELSAELSAELEARRTQYEHYRNQLLTFDSSIQTRILTLGDIGAIVTGRTPKSSEEGAWGSEVHFVTPSDIATGLKHISNVKRSLSLAGAQTMMSSLVPARSILVTCIGSDMGKTVINSEDCVTNQQINSIVLKEDVSPDYIYHLLSSKVQYLKALGATNGSTMPIINKTTFSKIEIELPGLQEQERVSVILNKFDSLVNDISSGLPAEITARRRQYEYYRTKLLTFQEHSVE